MTPEKGFTEDKASSSNGFEDQPKLRFPEFAGDWEPLKFSEFTYPAGKRNKENLDYEPYAITADYGFISQKDAHDEFGYMKGADKTAYMIVEPGSFAYNPARINIGSIGYYDGSEKVIVSSLYEVFQTSERVDDRFLWQWFKSDKFPRWIQKFQEGSVRLYFYYDKLCECLIRIPSLDEQIKIASFLEKINERIEKQTAYIDTLKKYKKGLLQNLFPRKGETVPRLRLTGFTGDWEQCKFKNAFNLLTNNTLSRAELSSDCGIAQNIHYGDILIKFGEVIDLKNVRLPYIADETKISKSALLQNGDIIIADTAEDTAVGKCVEIVGISDMDVVAGLHTIPCRPRKQYAQGYLGYFMNAPAYHDQLLPLMQGTKVTSVSKSALQDTVLYYPTDITEQARIGDYFTGFDILITRHRRVLDSLIQCKKGLLQQLFI